MSDDIKKPIIERKLTPEVKAALERWMPITTDPVDRFTPDYFRENFPSEKWPVIYIRKPGSLDLVNSMERTAVKMDEAESATAQVSAEAPPRKLSHADMAAMAREAVSVWRTRVIKFENMIAKDGSALIFEAKDGVITDECLNQVPWQTFMAVHFRYDALFSLSDLELEGLGSQPASV